MYHYTSESMTEENVARCKEIAKAKGFGFELSEVSPARFCFWVSNSYGGACSAKETNAVIEAIEEAGIELPRKA